MGLLYQFGALFTDLTVFENVAFPLREHTELPEHLIRDLVLLKLNAVGLRGAAHYARPSCRVAWRAGSRWRGRSRSTRR
jgi:phospholipid/cholesterol/gamma-HCH transport system ATP-binding protein